MCGQKIGVIDISNALGVRITERHEVADILETVVVIVIILLKGANR